MLAQGRIVDREGDGCGDQGLFEFVELAQVPSNSSLKQLDSGERTSRTNLEDPFVGHFDKFNSMRESETTTYVLVTAAVATTA